MPGNGAAASYGDLLITSLVVLAAVCIAAFVVVKLVGRFLATGRMRGAHLLDVVARLPLEPRRSLYVVEVAGKTLLVGTSEMGLSVLSELDGQEVRARAVPAQSFGDLVRNAWAKRRSVGDAPAADAPAGAPGGAPASGAPASGALAGDAQAGDARAGTSSAHVGATHDARGDDVSADAQRDHVGATHDARGDDVSAEAQRAHVGTASEREDA